MKVTIPIQDILSPTCQFICFGGQDWKGQGIYCGVTSALHRLLSSCSIFNATEFHVQFDANNLPMALQEHSCRFYLASCRTPHSKTKEGRRFGISLYFEFCKSCCMAFYRLGDFSINRIQLHCTNHTILLC